MNLQQAEQYLKNLEEHPEKLGAVFDRLLALNQKNFAQIDAWDRRISQLESQNRHAQNQPQG